MILQKLNLSISLVLLTIFLSFTTKKIEYQEKHPYYKTIDSLMVNCHKFGILNGSAIVSINDSIIYNNSFGYTDASKAKKLNDNSIFSIGSVAKEFNAISIMMLVEKGLLSLDDPLSKFDLELPEWSSKIKVKHLLSYSSGLPGINENDKNDEEVYNRLKSLKELDFEPGSGFNYNNNSIFLQKRIIEKISNQKFEDFVTDNIINPLNLKNVFFNSTSANSNFVTAFSNENVNDDKNQPSTTGWLNLSNNDLHQYLIALHAQKLISEKSLLTLFKTNFNNEECSLGSAQLENNKIITHYHQGSTYNFEAAIYHNSKSGLSITLTTNNKNFKLKEIVDAVENITQYKDFSMPRKSVYLTIREKCYANADEGIAYYQQLKTEFPDQYNFSDPGELNHLGYKLIQKEQLKGAIKVFELLIKEFPNESNAYDSYGEALLLDKQYNLSLKNYEKSLALNPNIENAANKIQEIKNKIANEKQDFNKSNILTDPNVFIGKHKAKAMVLGVFHFEDAGLDTYKPKFHVDMLNEKRQLELINLIESISKYKPTKILLERNRIEKDSLVNVEYQKFLNNDFEISDKVSEGCKIKMVWDRIRLG